ncbi:translation initiation factor IF-2 subunit beta [Candidatus Woesearchaeota archaeon]|nr:translation initiation factor IF-2 subunit beta [Candidatus Woesearchaeota archaeon]
MKYEEMLKLAKEKLPKVQSKSERFVVPKIQGHVEGNKTIIINIFSIADLLARLPEHILKYLQRELATPGYFQDKRLVFGRKLSSHMINEKLQKYVEVFVLCEQCSKPDTKLLTEEGLLVKKCMACGHKSQVQTKI